MIVVGIILAGRKTSWINGKSFNMEMVAMTGRHTRFSSIEMGAGFIDMIGYGSHWPSSKTTVGLGRSFAWNHFARINNIVDSNGRVIKLFSFKALRADLIIWMVFWIVFVNPFLETSFQCNKYLIWPHLRKSNQIGRIPELIRSSPVWYQAVSYDVFHKKV